MANTLAPAVPDVQFFSAGSSIYRKGGDGGNIWFGSTQIMTGVEPTAEERNRATLAARMLDSQDPLCRALLLILPRVAVCDPLNPKTDHGWMLAIEALSRATGESPLALVRRYNQPEAPEVVQMRRDAAVDLGFAALEGGDQRAVAKLNAFLEKTRA